MDTGSYYTHSRYEKFFYEREIEKMRKNTLRNGIVVALASMMAMATIAGCGNNAAEEVAGTEEVAVAEETLADESAPLTSDSQTVSELPAAPYFTKGVYAYFDKGEEDAAKTYFYVFYDDSMGYTEDGEEADMGCPFSMKQADGNVSFSFGGEDEDLQVFVVTGVENDAIFGHFESNPDREMVFEPVPDADPDNFSAVNYLNAANGEPLVYTDATGWSVKYDPSCITVNTEGPVTTFVYTGDCAGTCMMSVTYEGGKDLKTAAEDLAKSYGDQATATECVFPGTEDVPGYYVDAVPGQMGPGLYQMAYVREYMEGYLVFELIEHMGGDDEIDIPVSDTLSEIFNTLTF